MFAPSTHHQLLRFVAASTVGSVLYAVAIYLTAILNIPGTENVQFRPGIVIPILCGVFFGPLPGFISGLVGNLAADQLLGWGWWPFWYLGNGLVGLACGLVAPDTHRHTNLTSILGVLKGAALGIVLGMGLASLTERWVTDSSWNDIIWLNFVPAVLSNTINAVVLVPIILLCYGILRESTSVDIAE